MTALCAGTELLPGDSKKAWTDNKKKNSKLCNCACPRLKCGSGKKNKVAPTPTREEAAVMEPEPEPEQNVQSFAGYAQFTSVPMNTMNGPTPNASNPAPAAVIVNLNINISRDNSKVELKSDNHSNHSSPSRSRGSARKSPGREGVQYVLPAFSSQGPQSPRNRIAINNPGNAAAQTAQNASLTTEQSMPGATTYQRVLVVAKSGQALQAARQPEYELEG